MNDYLFPALPISSMNSILRRGIEDDFLYRRWTLRYAYGAGNAVSPNMAVDFCNTSDPLVLLGNEMGEIKVIQSRVPSETDYANDLPVIPWKMMQRYPDPIYDLQWAPDDESFAAAVADNHVYVHCSRRSHVLCCLGHHQKNVFSVSFQPGEREILATAGADGDICLWDLRTCGTNSLKNSPTTVISKAHNSTSRPMTPRSRMMATHTSSVSTVQFLRTGRDHLLASIGQPDYAIRFWDTRIIWGRNSTPRPAFEIMAPQVNRPRGRKPSLYSSI